MNKSNSIKVEESLPIGLELALVGGFMDAYTYINRGSVFATGQTGNLVLMGIRLSIKDYYGALMALVPIVFFLFGVFAAQYSKDKMHIAQNRYYQSDILIFEIVILFFVGFLPAAVPNYIANAIISFVSAMQFSSFRTMINGPYSTVFCTGNMRSFAELFYKGIFEKDKEAFSSAASYAVIILAFLSGGIISAVLSQHLFVKTIWVACALLIIPLISINRSR